MTDTIAAIATGCARTAIGILRISGPEAHQVLARVFTPFAGKTPLLERPAQTLIYGQLHDAHGAVLDHCLATFSVAPASYTGEDTAELQCHGSPTMLAAGLEALFAAGARQAKAGEFTRRAFLNGKMDLTQAEAVVDLIDAETISAAKNAVGQLSGAMGKKIDGIYNQLVDLLAHFHAVLDYPDEDIEPFEAEEIAQSVSKAAQDLAALRATYHRGKQLTQGVPCAIVGRPNAGKSSLLNAILGYDRAIVTDIPGTTRDTVEETVTCGGTLLRLIDTAGIHDTADAVEQLGVERSRKAAETADLVIAVVDGSQTPPTVDEDILSLSAQAPHWILAVSKNDLNPAAKTAVWQLPKELRDPDAFVSFSSVAPGGLDLLVDAVQSCFPAGTPADAGSLLTNARQESAVRRSLEAVRRALSALDSGLTPDAVLTDAEEALESIGELTGRTAKEEIVGAVFSRFCVGK